MTEWEYTAIVPPLNTGDGIALIYVNKVGGGTLGRAYEGTWECKAYGLPGSYRRETLTTGTPKRHDEVAAIYGEFLADTIDEDNDMDAYDRISCWTSVILPY